MERLTELEMNSIGFAILCNFPRFCGEERAKEASDMFRAMKDEITAYRALGTVDELTRSAALVKAQEEGRVHIDPPPAKEGDPKPSCFYEDGASLWCLGLSHEGDDEPIDRCKHCWYCESGDYADDRAEASAALQKGGTHETDPV